MTKTPLNQQTLASLDNTVSVPAYDRANITPGIIHIGVGNFHRAHQAVYLDDLFNLGLGHDWGIVGAGIKKFDGIMRQKLSQQDWLTTVVELDPQGYSARICGSMIDFAAVDENALIEALTAAEIRIVSLTITEGGYYLNSAGQFNANDQEIIHDINHPESPSTVFGILIAALNKRRAMKRDPFTILSCDNIPENGHTARNTLLGLAQEIDQDTAQWIEAEVAFPNCMVDCITPATTQKEIKLVSDLFNIEDLSPVVCEPFRQWVLEDQFPYGRPELEKAGASFVEDVAPHELMKLRILNGGHASIAYPAKLMGIDDVHEAMAEPAIKSYLKKLVSEEIIPTVPKIEGVNFNDYFSDIVKRFSNAEMGDTIDRLCLDGSNRQPKFILPTISDRLENDSPVDGLALEVALWCRYCAGTNDNGDTIEINDIKAETLKRQASLARKQPVEFLNINEIFGELGSNPKFIASFSKMLNSIWTKGTKATLESYAG